MSIKSFFTAVGAVIVAFFAGVVTFFCVDKRKKNVPAESEIPPEEIEKESQKVKEETKNEIEKTDAHTLADNSDSSSDIHSGIEKLQKDSTDRIRDRLKEIL